MFVITLSYLKPLTEMDRLRPAHLEFLDRYYAKNIFLTSGRQTPPTGGVILALADSKAALEQIIAEDPFYTEKAATYTITEFIPTKVNQNLADLLKVA